MKDIEFLKKNGVDVNKCLELFEDIKTYNETLNGFSNSLKNKLKKLDDYYKEEDMYNYSIFVHSIKSDCKYFGFMKLANIAFEHEMASKDNDINFVKKNYKDLVDEANKAKNIVDEYLKDQIDDSEIQEYESLFEDINIDDYQSGTIITEQKPITIKDEDLVEKEIIVVADDSEVVRIFVEKAFENKYQIEHASNGLETLKIINKHEGDNKIKAILLDLNMPKLDGFAVLDYMTESDLLKKMPVTIISGDSSKKAISKAFTYDIVDMINKPFSEQKIKEVVDKTILS